MSTTVEGGDQTLRDWTSGSQRPDWPTRYKTAYTFTVFWFA
jgi:hypothetical protein